MSLIDIQNLTIKNTCEKYLIKGIDLKIFSQQINALIGESGAGKSLIAKALLEYLPFDLSCTYDSYQFDGENISRLSQYYGHTIGYISQNYAESFNDHTKLGKQLTAIYRKHYKSSKEEALSKIDKALSWVNLQSKDILNKYSFQLSGGQLERVYIASVLMLEPKLIIADEPVASLDALNGNQVMDLLQHIVLEHGQTLFIITHNLSHVLKYCQYIYVLKEGQIIERGNINHFKYEHLHPYTERLIKYRTQLVLQDINITIPDGENVGILGESGCGKSTLASLVLGLFKPVKGEIYLSDNAVLTIFQHPLTSFNPDWTIETSLKEALYYYRGLTDNTAQDQLLLQHLSTFELNAQLLTKLPSEVSGGQLQRFNVMRSLLAQPRVLICDEITSNLDVIAEQNVINILKAQTITNLNHFIVISHDLSVLQRLVNRIIVLKDGMIVDDFAIEELFNVDRHPYTKELVQTFSY
ncbi:TPA: ABC transporter ATP-binding protein [Staphylococcus aureus]|nr:ABC transporter ATP-binding protein [Staphylococcus aureus]HEJ9250236.1 ABC transporter ATP-binding protein [Staphylococcus aureus]